MSQRSHGYAIRNTAQDVLDDVMRVADQRMYEAKALMKKRRTDKI